MGIGKSYLNEMILSHLKKKASQYYKADLILWTALTGVVAFNIYNKTLHQLFCFLIWSKFYLLIAATLFLLQN